MNKKEILEKNLGFIISEVEKYLKKYNIPYDHLEDMINEAVIGYLIAIERYDDSKNANINTYASYWIKAKLNDYRLKNILTPLNATYYGLYKVKYDNESGKFIRKENNKDVKVDSDIGFKNIYFSKYISLDRRINNEEELSDYIESIISSKVNVEEEVINKITGEEVLDIINNVLDEREKLIIHLRYFEEKTLEEVKEKIKLSRERIRQIEAKAIKKLRKYFLQKGVRWKKV